MIRSLILAALLAIALLPVVTFANSTNMTRQEIKSIPMTERPNRIGHFYGNTVRRIDQRRR